jgi:hypothetical protein
VIALGLPAAALASKPTERVVTKTITEKSADGFRLRIEVAQGALTGYGGRYPNEFIIDLNKTSGKSTQANQYTFYSKKGFKGSSSLSSGSFKDKFSNGYGSLKMTFHATGSTFTIHTPKGCQGAGGKGRHGTLRGTMTIKAGGKLGTVKLKSISATLSTATYTCNPTQPKGVSLVPPPTAKTEVLASKSTSGAVTEEISVTQGNPKTYYILHSYTVTAPSSDYTYSSDLKSATLKGAGGIKGTATFNGTTKEGNNKEVGTLSGSTFQVRMASIGVVKPLTKPQKGYLQQRT